MSDAIEDMKDALSTLSNLPGTEWVCWDGSGEVFAGPVLENRPGLVRGGHGRILVVDEDDMAEMDDAFDSGTAEEVATAIVMLRNSAPAVVAENDSLREQVRALTEERDEWKGRAESRQDEIQRQMTERQREWQSKQNEAAAYERSASDLRKQVEALTADLDHCRVSVGRALTEERDDWRRKALDRDLQTVDLTTDRDTLRSRVAELEAERVDLIDRVTVAEVACEQAESRATEYANLATRTAYERDAAQRRVQALETTVVELLLSADALWEEKGGGNDWAEACARARNLLTPKNTPEEG